MTATRCTGIVAWLTCTRGRVFDSTTDWTFFNAGKVVKFHISYARFTHSCELTSLAIFIALTTLPNLFFENGVIDILGKRPIWANVKALSLVQINECSIIPSVVVVAART